jgi:hypothetical protein
MIYLSELVESLQADVPAQDGVPSEAQYEAAIKKAVQDFGLRAGHKKIATLNIVAGTAIYDLPADFLKIISLSALYAQDGIINTAAGIIPLSADFSEEYTIRNGKITFYPTPLYTLARTISYKAGYALTSDDYGELYDDLGEREADIAMLMAQGIAVTKIANAAAGEGGFSYRQGDVTVDLTGHVMGLQNTAKALENQYLQAVEVYIGTVLVME